MDITLNHGLKVGQDVLTDVKLRQLSAGDILDASEESERLMMTADGPALVPSPARMGAEILRRQIASIGNLQGPISLAELRRLHPEDMERLQAAAAGMDAARARELTTRGRDAAGGAGAGTPGSGPVRPAADATE